MLCQNSCTFAKIEDGQINSNGEKCGLYFKNLLELIHHIEEEHIPLIENAKTAERKRLREQFSDDPEQYEKAYTASLNQPVPLSLICRLKPFPKGHKVYPIAPPKQRTLKFCHFKPKSNFQQQVQPTINNNVRQTISPLNSEMISTNDQHSTTITSKKINENHHNRPREASTSSECLTPDLLNGGQSPGQQLIGVEERKYRCQFDGCLKTYKNQQGLKQHMRTTHNSSLDHSTSISKLSASEEGILSRQFPGRQSPFLSSMVFNSPVNSTDSSNTSKTTNTKINETLFLVTTGAISMPVNSSSVGNTSSTRDNKYQCQQCASSGKEFRVFKTLPSLNKHLRDAHGAVTLSPSRYSSGQHQKLIHIYSPQQSPQRPISVGVSQQVSMLHSQSGGSFVTPALTMSRQSARPSAPIPPSTPPPPSPYSSAVTLITSSTSYSYSPQKYQHIQQQQNKRQNNFTIISDHSQDQHAMGSTIQHQYYTNVQSIPSIDQQPPVLHPQQQFSNGNLSQQRYLRYTYQQPEQQQQQLYSSQETSPSYAYSSSIGGNENSTGTTTIYVTHQQPPPHQLGPQQTNYETSSRTGYEQDSFGRTVYRQPEIQHYLVESTGQQQNSGTYIQPGMQPQQSNGNRLIPTTSVTTIRTVPIGGSHPNQQVGMQQQFQQNVYGQSRNNVYGESMQQSYINPIRSAPVQQPTQQRIYQQNQFYNQQRSQMQGTRRQSPATVAAVLAETSP